MSSPNSLPFPWLAQYASNYHHWRIAERNGQKIYYRPLGFVENAFDSDGIYHEGRADVHAVVRLKARIQCSEKNLRERITAAWAALQLHHGLLQAKALNRQDYMDQNISSNRDRFFVVESPRDSDAALEVARNSLVFLGDYHNDMDQDDFHYHAQNAARIPDEKHGLSKLFVLPLLRNNDSTTSLRFEAVMGHQITDGLSNANWIAHFMRLLNTPTKSLLDSIPNLIENVHASLPVAQEDLYPPVSGNLARARWFWLLTLVLRHVRKPYPAAFPNPLRRSTPLSKAIIPPLTYTSVLNYNRPPPLNTATSTVRLSNASTQRLHRLCRSVSCSIGAGCFVIVAISMMNMHTLRNPSVPDSKRAPFIGSFPIDARSFLAKPTEPNSCMLAFSDGVVLPWLSPTLPLNGRIRLLLRTAHRQLSRYQKRRRVEDADAKVYMSSRGAGRVVAMNYISAVERGEAKLPEHLRTPGRKGPQGDLSVVPNGSMATCGVSSVGKAHPGLRPGLFDLDGDGGDGLVVDMDDMRQNVRARDGEFLVGVSGSDERISINVSYDGNAIDENLVKEWEKMMRGLLEEQKARL
ncbi:hypothetical protein MBLNU457_g0754t1 [Dothideomycetes sp. NU457]